MQDDNNFVYESIAYSFFKLKNALETDPDQQPLIVGVLAIPRSRSLLRQI